MVTVMTVMIILIDSLIIMTVRSKIYNEILSKEDNNISLYIPLI